MNRVSSENLIRYTKNLKTYIDTTVNSHDPTTTVLTFNITEADTKIDIKDLELTIADWGDGTVIHSSSHTYKKTGTFTCRLTGVTSIAAKALVSCSSLISVVIGESVAKIGKSAFYECTKLTSVEIPDSVTSIGEYAFYGCSSLTSVEIPDSVTTIGQRAFYNCTNLTSAKINGAITETTLQMFQGCTSLQSVSLPNTLTTIGDRTFNGCKGLSSIIIPKSVTKIESNAFYQCSSLTIYCEAECETGENQPAGWASNWNSSNCHVVWGYSLDQVKQKLTEAEQKLAVLDQLYYIKKLSLQKSVLYKKFQCTCNFIWSWDADEEWDTNISDDFSEDANVSVHLNITENGVITINATATDYNQTRSVISGAQFYLTKGASSVSLGTTNASTPVTINTSGIVKLLPTENKCKINSVFYNKEKEASNISIGSTQLAGTVYVTYTITDEDDDGPSGGTAYYYISSITITWYEGIELDVTFNGDKGVTNLTSYIYPTIYSSGNETVIEYDSINEANSTYGKLV